MTGTLGTGVHTAVIYERGGRRPLINLDRLLSVEWNRVKNQASEALITLPADAACNPRVGQVRSWGHELVLFRDGNRVWEGPVIVPSVGRGRATIRARDVSGYLARRVRRRQNAKVLKKRVITFAEDDVRDAFAADDPNVLTYLDVRGTASGRQITRKRADSENVYVSDLLDSMADKGLNRTTAGRTLVLWPSSVHLGLTPTLNASLHIAADVTVEENGDDLATSVLMDPDKGKSRWSSAWKAVDPFYGLHEFIGDASGLKGATTGDPKGERPGEDQANAGDLLDAANAVRDEHYPAPLRINIPAGATLNCDAPFPLDTLIPGVLIPVEVTDTVRPVTARMTLSEVKVTVTGGVERVQITLDQVTEPSEVPA